MLLLLLGSSSSSGGLLQMEGMASIGFSRAKARYVCHSMPSDPPTHTHAHTDKQTETETEVERMKPNEKPHIRG